MEWFYIYLFVSLPLTHGAQGLKRLNLVRCGTRNMSGLSDQQSVHRWIIVWYYMEKSSDQNLDKFQNNLFMFVNDLYLQAIFIFSTFRIFYVKMATSERKRVCICLVGTGPGLFFFEFPETQFNLVASKSNQTFFLCSIVKEIQFGGALPPGSGHF